MNIIVLSLFLNITAQIPYVAGISFATNILIGFLNFQVFEIVLFLFIIGTEKLEDSIPLQPTSWRRIIGGIPATIKEFPYLVSLQRQGMHYCGGSVISVRWILSAAHCLFFSESGTLIPPNEMAVVFGLNDITKPSENHTRSVAATIPHPKFNRYTMEFDIGLIMVKETLLSDNTVHKTNLVKKESAKEGHVCTVIGWGFRKKDLMLSSMHPFRPSLYKVEVPIISTMQCRWLYPENHISKDYHLCAAAQMGGRDACQGDSGGPMICSGVQVAITSWGDSCGEADSPGVYVRTDYFSDWINYHTQEYREYRSKGFVSTCTALPVGVILFFILL